MFNYNVIRRLGTLIIDHHAGRPVQGNPGIINSPWNHDQGQRS